ncbi:MAG: hypothetical protein ACKVZ0_17845 [Gemmatimonadales bacterium]
MPPGLTPAGPGIGDGWSRLVEVIRQALPTAEVDRIWVFRTIRHQAKDFGTAILSRIDGDRRRIYTARFVLTVKGKTRGRFESAMLEVGSGPIGAIEELLALVPKRSDEEEPPIEIPAESWFPKEVEAVADPG